MALINCPNCGKQISDQAEKCIHCGFMHYQENINKDFDDAKDSPMMQKQQSSGIGYTIFGIIIFLTAVFVVLWFSGLIDDYKPRHKYPSDVVQNFMNWCMLAGGSADECRCALDKVQRKYSYRKMQRIEEDILSGRPPSDFAKFVNKAKH